MYNGEGNKKVITVKKEIDMLHGSTIDKIITIALPLAAISILQQFFNAADVAVVGRFGSSTALAAVGANTTIINMFITFFSGLSAGGNVALSTAIGEDNPNKVKKTVNTVFTLSLISAVIVIVAGQIIAKPLLQLIGTPDSILKQALLYLRIYFFALMFAVIFNFTSAILRSKGDTQRPLYCLIASGILNIILNLIFVIGFHLDVAGVALATLISNILCALLTIYFLMNEKDDLKISFKELKIEKESLIYTLKIGLPAGVQGMLFSVSNMIIQTGINSFGADCIAGNTAAMNFEFIAYFIVNAFGQTALTFMSQNYGATQYDRMKKVCRECLLLGLGCSFVLSLCFYMFGRFWIGLFTTSSAVMGFALVRMQYVVLLEPITAFNEMPSAGLRSMGISIEPTIISILGSCVLRIIWVNTIFTKWHTIQVLMLVYPVSWVFIGILAGLLYIVKSMQLK